VECWGANTNAQLGRGSTNLLGTPSEVLTVHDGPALTGVTLITTGDDHTCVCLSSNETLCWGRNDAGQSGGCEAGRCLPATVPTPLSGIKSVVSSLSAGPFYSCARAGVNGDILCWGDNSSNQWGGAHAQSGSPVKLLGGAMAISAGGSPGGAIATSSLAHACGIFSDRAYCWGSPDRGRLGNGMTSGSPTEGPVPVSLPERVVQVSAGSDHACAVLEDGRVACWGKNNSWQVTGRTGTPVTIPTPFTVGIF
jgi:alpha-tubulin suppressor-like RCC1 family protein